MENILLAAGLGTRSGGEKLFLPWKGETVLAHAVRASLEAGLRTIVVTGYRSEEARQLLASFACPQLVVAYNDAYASGQGSSTICGARHLRGEEEFFISLSDMPLIESLHYRKLAENPLGSFDALRPVCGTEKGHPVLLDRRMRRLILAQDLGFRMRDLLATRAVRTVATKDRAYVTDIDTIEAYERLSGR